MKTTLLILLLSISAYAQDYAYFRTGFDLNNAIGIIDNPRTEIEILGYDADFEIGARDRHIGVYITHGRFEAQDYQNYAAGVDYYVNWLSNTQAHLYNPFTGNRFRLFKGIDMSAGLNYGAVFRRSYRYLNYEKTVLDEVWKGYSGLSARATTAFKILDQLTMCFTLQRQARGELMSFGDSAVWEGSMGIEYRLHL